MKYNEISEINDNANDFPSVDEAIHFLNSTLFSSGLQSIPRTTGIFNRRPVPWWSNDCRIAHRTMRAAYSRYKRHNSEYYKIEFKKARANFRRVIKTARKDSWSNFVSSINSKTPLSLVWKKVRKISGKYTPPQPPVLKINGTNVADNQIVADTLANHFASVSKKDEGRPNANYRRREEQKPLNFNSNSEERYNLPFTQQEFDSSISSSKDSAPGPDNITYSMVAYSHMNTKKFILDIINRIYREHAFPTVWESATILPFNKPGKDKMLPCNYRPIALTSCICKLMEKMVNARLVWYLEKGNHLSPNQCGFRQMRSTSDALIRLEASICEAFAARKHHVTVFFDLEKAYDTAWRYGILKELHEIGLRGPLPLFIKAFLYRRTFQVRIGATLSTTLLQEEGVPQGSVISVTLFALSVNQLSKIIPPDVMHTFFVDDLSMSFAASHMPLAERRLQLAIDKVVKEAELRGFRFSQSKTVAVHFCHLRGHHPDPDLFLNGQRISCVEETRFLGVVFDNRLTWVPHFKQLKVKCLKALDILKVLSHTTWGADRSQLLRLYKALVFSKLTYGCEIYTSATERRLKTLNSIHHAGIRLSSGAFKSSPVESLLIDAGEISLDLHYQTLLARSWHRFQRIPNSLAYKTIKDRTYFPYYENHPKKPHPFSYRVELLSRKYNIPLQKIIPKKFSVIPPWTLPVVEPCFCFKQAKKEMSDVEIKSLFLDHSQQHDNCIPVFTDGTKSEAGVGFGVVFPGLERSGRLPNNSSIFTAELSAILRALKEILIQDPNEYIIYCDSKSVLQSLNHFNPAHPLILDILEWLIVAKRRGHNIEFCWVPAHVGIAGNERADQVAKSSIIDNIARNCPLPFRDIYPVIRNHINIAWQQYWDSLTDSNKKLREITSSISPWTYCFLPRRWETALCRLRIGHTRLTHGFLMENGHQPYCDDCIVPLSVKHFLTECPSFIEEREHYLGYGKDHNGQFVLSKILGKEGDFTNVGLFGYLTRLNILDKL
ncbi:MAG: reverse transcriptase domain-containing protein [Bacteroidota bacterium]